MPTKQDPIIIVGAGAWGLSTALHLNLAGYLNITIFEQSEEIPSPWSAACDLNKIVRAEYEDPFYTGLALEAIEAWKSPLFGSYYHQTGYVVAATGKAPPKATEHLEKALASISTHPAFTSKIQRLSDGDDFKELTWQYSGPLTGFKGYFNRLGGYAHSADALKGISQHCQKKGVKITTGPLSGRVVKLLYENGYQPAAHGKNTTIRCIGVQTADSKHHYASTTICALGAYNAALLPQVRTFVAAKCWSIAHVQLSEQETNYLRGIPTTNVRDLGFFVEPDLKTRLFKLCPLGAGFTNTNAEGASVPPPLGAEPAGTMEDFIPADDEKKLRQLLRETFPWMADRPFVHKKLCWFADTADSDFCIDYVPATDRSLVVLSGDSGHGFKMMPVFGKWVVELLGRGEQSIGRWRWREEDTREKDWAGGVSWRIGEAREYKDLVEESGKVRGAKL